MRARRIPLTQGQFALVDEKHYADLAQFKWQARWDPGTKSYYASRTVRQANGKNRIESMHRRIMGLAPGDPREVDHKNHDTLDNRLSNLRIVTRRQQAENRRNQSQHGVGVWQHKNGRFYAHAWHIDRKRSLGGFATREEAVAARSAFVKEITRG